METAAEQEVVVIEQIAAAGFVGGSVAVQDLRNLSWWKTRKKKLVCIRP